MNVWLRMRPLDGLHDDVATLSYVNTFTYQKIGYELSVDHPVDSVWMM